MRTGTFTFGWNGHGNCLARPLHSSAVWRCLLIVLMAMRKPRRDLPDAASIPVSVIVPAYNEDAVLTAFHHRLAATLDRLGEPDSLLQPCGRRTLETGPGL